jgi:hypothetical protein
VRHRKNFPRPEEQEDQQHVQVKPSIESGTEDVIIPRPQLVPIPVSPVHDNETSDDTGRIACADIAVEVRQTTEEDSRVEEVEFWAWEEPMK